MGRKCKAVVDSGEQVTVINKDFLRSNEGKHSRPVRLKGVAEDNSLMADVVDDVEFEMGVFQRRIEFLCLLFRMNASLDWIQ